MEIVNLKHPNEPIEWSACGLCLGNFDGVHLGHRALIDELKRLNAARDVKLPLGALCFSKPPSLYLSRHPVPQLATNEEKFRLFREAGLAFVVLFDFAELRDLAPEAFVYDILISKCRCQMAVCGFNYTYGARGSGNAETLAKTFAATPERTLSVVPPITDGRVTVSSSEIRRLLLAGHPEDAARMLGRPYAIVGKVKSGRQIGRLMGFPTANIAFPEGALVPAHGVYLSTVRIARRTYFGITNIGCRPTFETGGEVNAETFLFDYNGDLYKKELRVSLLRFLREEKHFPSREALEAQIQMDVERAKEYIG